MAPSLVGGFGLKMANYQIDGSVNPMGELGLVSKFSFTMRFGSQAGEESWRTSSASPSRRAKQARARLEGGNPELENTVIHQEVQHSAESQIDNGDGGFIFR